MSKSTYKRFSVYQSNDKDMMIVCIKTTEYDPLKKWLPYIDWDGTYMESYPMQTSFICPCNKIDYMKEILIDNYFIEIINI